MDIQNLLKYKSILEVLIKYYEEEVDTYYKANARYKIWLWINTIIYGIASLILTLSFALIRFKNGITIISIALLALVSAIGLFLLLVNSRNKYRNKLLEEKYHIRVKKHKKVNEIANVAEINRMKKFMQNHIFKSSNQANKEKIIELLISKIEEKAQTNIASRIFIPSIFAAMFIPTWIEYLGIVFKDKDFNLALNLVVVYSGVAFLISLIVGYISMFGKDMRSLFEIKEKQIMKIILNDLRIIHLGLICEEELYENKEEV